MTVKGELINFITEDKIGLNGLLTDSGNSSTAVLHIPGMFSDMTSSVGQLVAEVCQEINISCFLINTRGSGIVSSFNKYINDTEKEYYTGGTSYEIFEECIYDIDAAINVLKEKGFTKIILSGHSTGSQKIIHYALDEKSDDIISGLMFLAPGDDLNINKRKLGERFQNILDTAKELSSSETLFEHPEFSMLSAKRYYEQNNERSIEGRLFNYENDLNHISAISIPILSVFGKDEQYAIISPKDMLNKIASNYKNNLSETKLIGGNHSFETAEQELKQIISKWIIKII